MRKACHQVSELFWGEFFLRRFTSGITKKCLNASKKHIKHTKWCVYYSNIHHFSYSKSAPLKLPTISSFFIPTFSLKNHPTSALEEPSTTSGEPHLGLPVFGSLARPTHSHRLGSPANSNGFHRRINLWENG